MSEHSPAPWQSGDHGTGQAILDANGLRIASLAFQHGSVSSKVSIGQTVANTNLMIASPDLLVALQQLNHMGGDERGGYCICPRHDGSAMNGHSTACADARAAIRKAQL